MKTLKDLGTHHLVRCGNPDDRVQYEVLFKSFLLEHPPLEPLIMVPREELRTEAINQIKYLETEFITERPKDLADVYKNKAAYQIQWIKHFFNITEEDLK